MSTCRKCDGYGYYNYPGGMGAIGNLVSFGCFGTTVDCYRCYGAGNFTLDCRVCGGECIFRRNVKVIRGSPQSLVNHFVFGYISPQIPPSPCLTGSAAHAHVINRISRARTFSASEI